jgi:hypothetical protein
MQLEGMSTPLCVETTLFAISRHRANCIDSQDDLVYQKSRLKFKVKDHTTGSTSFYDSVGVALHPSSFSTQVVSLSGSVGKRL